MLMVDDLYERLGLADVIGPLKEKGVDLNALTKALVSYKLSENDSILRGAQWLNSEGVRGHYDLPELDSRTLYRAVDLLGQYRDRILVALQDSVLRLLDQPKTDVLMDWTNLIFWGRKAKKAKFGHSNNGRPEERQVAVGVAQLAPPVNVPIALTIEAGNMNDLTHFQRTYAATRRILQEGSLITFDAGAMSAANLNKILLDKNDYLTRMEQSKSTDKAYEKFGGDSWTLVDERTCTFVKVRVFPHSVNYYFRSGKLEVDQNASLRRRARRELDDAKSIRQSLEDGKGLPKRFRCNNRLVDVEYSYQMKLGEMSDEEAVEYLIKERTTGREGCFILITNRKGVPAADILSAYRAKDAIEKLFHSLKGDLEVGPLRVHRDHAVDGVILLSFLAQVLISLTRVLYEPVRQMATKFVVLALERLTLTVELLADGRRRRVYSNFNPVNRAILARYLTET
jgi:transposase